MPWRKHKCSQLFPRQWWSCLWHAGEVFFKHLLLFRNGWKLNEPLNVLYHVIWEASKAPKHRILIHHSDIPQLMLCRCRILSMKHKLYISVLSHNFYGITHTKQGWLSVVEIMHSLICWTVRQLSNLWCCIFWHLGTETLNFITTEGRLKQDTKFSQ